MHFGRYLLIHDWALNICVVAHLPSNYAVPSERWGHVMGVTYSPQISLSTNKAFDVLIS